MSSPSYCALLYRCEPLSIGIRLFACLSVTTIVLQSVFYNLDTGNFAASSPGKWP